MQKKYFKSLGRLEQQVMDIVWDFGDASVREVLDRLRKKRTIAYTTVMTIMARLSKKGLLRRRMDKSGCYIYSPLQDKGSYISLVAKNTISRLISDYGELAVAQFIDVVETSNLKKLADWKKKLKKVK